MAETNQVIYVPGFGNTTWKTQAKALKKWERHDLIVHFMPINWENNETYESKLHQITSKIDELTKDGAQVSLVGVSAGGSLTLNAYNLCRDKVEKVVLICGKLSNPAGVRQYWFKDHPAFQRSIFSSPEVIKDLTPVDKQKMLTVRSFYDRLIPAADSEIPDVKNKVLPVPLHVVTIFLAISLFKKTIISFLKSA